ncbi:hypothetical protein TNCV_2759611 [Trichonephila clavipes]|nr:hypothetical protein TNCV_2759611 [Trichonephila clavipes]
MGLVFSGDPGSVHAVGGREDHGRTSPRFPPTQQWAHVIHESDAAFARTLATAVSMIRGLQATGATTCVTTVQ